MAEAFTIIHPERDRVFRHPFFIAYGRGPDGRGDVTGVLTDVDGKEVARGHPFQGVSRKHWYLMFRDLPHGSGYTLHLRDVTTGKDYSVPNLSVSPDLSPARVLSIGIDYPGDDDMPVGTTFITYGSTNETVQPSAYLTPSAGGTVTFLWGPPDNPPNWAFEFADQAEGSYTLTVAAGASQENRAIVIDEP